MNLARQNSAALATSNIDGTQQGRLHPRWTELLDRPLPSRANSGSFAGTTSVKFLTVTVHVTVWDVYRNWDDKMSEISECEMAYLQQT